MTDLERAFGAGVALAVIYALIPLLDRLIYWGGYLAGRLWKKALERRIGRDSA